MGYAGGYKYNFNPFILNLNSQKAYWICVVLTNRIKLVTPNLHHNIHFNYTITYILYCLIYKKLKNYFFNQ